MLEKLNWETSYGLLKLLLVGIAGLLVFACAAPRVKQAVLMPANADAMASAKKIAVLHFHGDRHNEFTREVEYYFSNIVVENQPYFQVVDHDAMQAIVDEQFPTPTQMLDQVASIDESEDINSILSTIETIARGVSEVTPVLGHMAPRLPPPPAFPRHNHGRDYKRDDIHDLPDIDFPGYLFRPDDAVTLGRLSGADTILTGVVKWPTVQHDYYKADRSRCVQTERSKTASGSETEKCVQYEKYQVPCTKQLSNIEFLIKAVNINNQEIVFTRRYSAAAENHYCRDDKQDKRMSHSKLSQIAIARAIKKMRYDVAPYTVVLTINLMKKDDSRLADNKEAKALLDQGMNFAAHNRLDRACENFSRAEKLYTQSPALYYNLGVCAEIKNQLDEASQLYGVADSLTTRNNKTINAALHRIKDRMIKSEQVAEQMR